MMLEATTVQITSPHQLDQLVDFACRIWFDDPLFSTLFPDRHERPRDIQRTWRLLLKNEYSQPGTVILVLCKGQHGGLDDAIGLSVWRRHGAGKVARSWQGDTLRKRLMRLQVVLELICRLASLSIPFGKAKALAREMDKAERLYPAERWRLCWLGVSNDFQRCGIGARMVQWGIDRSEEEGVPMVLEASQAGSGLYRKLGFEEIGWQTFDQGKYSQPIMLREAHEVTDLV